MSNVGISKQGEGMDRSLKLRFQNKYIQVLSLAALILNLSLYNSVSEKIKLFFMLEQSRKRRKSERPYNTSIN